MKRLLGALEILHSHTGESFHQRLFQASGLIFKESRNSFELYHLTDRTHTIVTDIPLKESARAELYQRVAELVPQQHPVFKVAAEGKSFNALRLTDMVTQRQFRQTDLYHEVFKPMDVNHQMILPIDIKGTIGALAINRLSKDYTDEEHIMASIFAKHMSIALESNRVLETALPQQQELSEIDFQQWRRSGLTRRECEVLWWLTKGKRDQEMAIIFGTSIRTIHQHVSRVLDKLKVENRTAAAAMALARLISTSFRNISGQQL